MRPAIAVYAVLFAAIAPAAAAMPVPPATSDKLEQLATIVEGMRGSSTVVDQRVADMLRPFAATEGIAIPAKAAPYTSLPWSAYHLRPKGWLVSISEMPNGYVSAGLLKYDAGGGVLAGHEKSGQNNSTSGSSAGALALSAAMLRAWAQDMRQAGL